MSGSLQGGSGRDLSSLGGSAAPTPAQRQLRELEARLPGWSRGWVVEASLAEVDAELLEGALRELGMPSSLHLHSGPEELKQAVAARRAALSSASAPVAELHRSRGDGDVLLLALPTGGADEFSLAALGAHLAGTLPPAAEATGGEEAHCEPVGEAIELPTDLPAPATRSPRRVLGTSRIDPATAADLERGSAAGGVGMRAALAACLAGFVSRCLDQDGTVELNTSAGPAHRALHAVAPVHAVAVAVDDGATLASLALALAMAQAGRTGPAVLRAPSLEQGLLAPPVLEVVDGWPARIRGARVDQLAVHRDHPESALGLILVRQPDGAIAVRCDLPADVHLEASAAATAARFAHWVGAAAGDPTAPIGVLPLPTPEERARILGEWAVSERHPAKGSCVHRLIEQEAARRPSAIAVRCGAVQLTYAELERQAELLAAHLAHGGVGPESRVALCLPPSAEIVVAVLAVLKTGGAYVPLDVEAPAARLASILESSGAACVLTTREAGRELPGHLRRVLLDPGWAEALGPAPRWERPRVEADQLAYIVYTSGSTGEPKGVMIPRGALLNHSHSVARRFGLTAEDHVLQFTPIHFDAAGEEIYPPLLSGASISVRGELVPTTQFRQLIESERFSVLSLPPAYVQEWLGVMESRGERLPAGLRLVLLGGEKLLPETRALWERLGGEQVPWINVYGPTEATITAAMCEISPGGFGLKTATLPIGRPIPNVELYLVDRNLQLVPPGHPGEIVIGGPGLARGYVGNPALTAEKFVPNPFSSTPGARLYRTGDVGRSLADGRVEFLGRRDHQVKLRGFRIELGEIESVIRKLSGVQDVVALVVGEGAEKKLVAYVVPKPGQYPTRRDVRDAVGAALPGYMVPSSVTFLAQLPLSSNGKVDRRALPPPDDARDEPAGSEEPLNETESALAEIWREVLGVSEVRKRDDFFELGGHSLSAMQILARIGETLGIELDIRCIFDQPTLAGLAEEVDRLRAQLGTPAPVDVNALSEDQVEAMLRDLMAKG